MPVDVDPTISLTNILTVVVMAVGFIIQWATMKNDIKNMSDRHDRTDTSVGDLVTRMRVTELMNARSEEKWSQVQRSLARIEKKLFEDEG